MSKGRKGLTLAVNNSKIQCRIEQIEGTEIVIADILTFWMRGYHGKRSTIRRKSNRLMYADVISSLENEDSICPNVLQITEVL